VNLTLILNALSHDQAQHCLTVGDECRHWNLCVAWDKWIYL